MYTLVDVLTSLGGLFSSLSVIGASSGKVFGYNLMLSSMIRKLYHFKPRFESEVKKKKKKKGGKKTADNAEAEEELLKGKKGDNEDKTQGGGDEAGEDDIIQAQFKLFSDKIN